MKLKRFICTALGTAMLASAAFVPTANAWSIYDSDYGMEWNEQSKTAVTDDMEQFREKDDPNDFTSLVYTVRDDGSAMITDYSARFMGDPDSGFGIELTVPSEINGHPVTAIGDGALREGSMRIFGITLPPTIREIGVNAIYGRYLKIS